MNFVGVALLMRVKRSECAYHLIACILPLFALRIVVK